MANPLPPSGNRPQGTPFRNLVVASSAVGEGGAGVVTQGAERRRLPRVALTQEQFRLKANGKIFSVCDLSCGGMALRVIDENDYILLTVGSQVEGLLNLRREKILVRGQVRHLLGNRVGIEFGALEPTSRTTLEKFLDPRILGADLRPMPTSESLAGLWFHGSSGTDLWLERQLDGSLKQFLLVMLGGFVRWSLEAPAGVSQGGAGGSLGYLEVEGGFLSTGRVDAAVDPEERAPDESRGVIRIETHWLNPDPTPDVGKMTQAEQILEASSLGEDLRRLLTRRLRRTSG